MSSSLILVHQSSAYGPITGLKACVIISRRNLQVLILQKCLWLITAEHSLLTKLTQLKCHQLCPFLFWTSGELFSVVHKLCEDTSGRLPQALFSSVVHDYVGCFSSHGGKTPHQGSMREEDFVHDLGELLMGKAQWTKTAERLVTPWQ